MAAMVDLSPLPQMLAAADWRGAEALLRRAAADRRAPAAVHYNLAKVLVEGGKPAQAGIWFRRAVTAAPDHAAAWFEYGRWAVDRGDLPLASAAFAKAAALAPDDADARRNLGRVALRLGDWPRALAAWQALGDDPEAAAGRYQAQTELHGATMDAARALLRAQRNAAGLQAITRTARGALPFDLGG
ncbi:MAG: tetratricopeptide (TPR) repeat protein [Paracoccaceae bacterium]|jgi:tetratricopeptide (TPR) repeat protein